MAHYPASHSENVVCVIIIIVIFFLFAMAFIFLFVFFMSQKEEMGSCEPIRDF